MKPALFNTEMVKAILDGRKTATRRVVKLKYRNTHLTMRTDKYGTRLIELQNEEPGVTTVRNPDGTTSHKLLAAIEKTPPYCPGDILYVRETWGDYSECQPGGAGYYLYRADYPYEAKTDVSWDGVVYDLPRWRPSIHMPKEAARLFLRIKDVRVERLYDITEDGAKQEGIQYTDFGTYLPNWKMSIDGGKTFHSPKKEIHHPGYHVRQTDTPEKCYPTARGAFRALWDSTIKPEDRALYGWEANPWVWVIEFERITKEEAENA